MVKTITRVGNSSGIILDGALLELARLKAGDQLSVTVTSAGAIVLTPVNRTVTPQEARGIARRIVQKNSEIFRRLA